MTILLGPSTVTDPRRMLKAWHDPKIVAAGHLRDVLDPDYRKELIKTTIDALAWHDFEAIAITGLSGALIAPIIAEKMGKTLIVVRKGEKTHSDYKIEGDRLARRYVILDDIIATGKTVARIITTINEEIPKETPQCIGAFMYLKSNPDSDTQGRWYTVADLRDDGHDIDRALTAMQPRREKTVAVIDSRHASRFFYRPGPYEWKPWSLYSLQYK